MTKVIPSLNRPSLHKRFRKHCITPICKPMRLGRKNCPAGNYMFKVNNRNTRTKCEICSKLTIKTPERR